ncbi:venom carboxylesterase-6-like isoform X1 [Pseudomyrmex gracilis]|uniref:venom carboxylesterase-6-like isoform X1 n=1 Tax=Pseudomyrmex gracilis TaxID=219809 RepID=UPI0009949781|nr:venom carboxylesterase-6-like isoform X1 [Pseudomyrmex gracilis]
MRNQDNILIRLICICPFLFNVCINAHNNDNNNDMPMVTIQNGTLVGTIMRSRLGREFNAFRGIPYARPPVDKLRFKPPQPMVAWNGVRMAVKDAEVCTQRNIYTYQKEIVGGEDCLYLNVYAPRMPSPQGYPVMFWIHGGGWVTGAGHSEYYHPKYLLDHDLVLVTINFRLGPLGFLSTQDEECPGNLGLKDQAQAMRWVQENIAAFNGDPNNVTIFGESAGGASVHYHMISSLSRGLFHRGISQSGTFYSPWTIMSQESAKKKLELLGSHLNCPVNTTSKDLLECLRLKTPQEIIGTDRIFQTFGYCPMIPFRPVIEPDHPGAFLTEDPLISVKKGRLADIPWMTGVTSEEGALKVAGLYGRFRDDIKRLNNNFMEIAPSSLMYQQKYNLTDSDFQNEISGMIRRKYFGDGDIDESEKSRFGLINLYSDAWFTHGTYSAIRDLTELQTSPIYYYYFAYRGSASFSQIFGDSTKNYGVVHADELQYLFPVRDQLFKDTLPNEMDYVMIDLMTTLWYNFAKYGNPTPNVTSLITEIWKPVQTTDLYRMECFHIRNPSGQISNLPTDRIMFWNMLEEKIKARANAQERLNDEL